MEEQALGVFQSTQQTQAALQERAAVLEAVKAEFEQKTKEVCTSPPSLLLCVRHS